MLFIVCAGAIDVSISFRWWPAPATAMPVSQIVIMVVKF